ncbi:MAG: cytochrome o ubiquinol oxidase subunit III [Planctomycetota bacterium]|nr:MAG: cytochrome o ubiquinol oxidase subunit III [Planctomycetota bacterium]
MTTHALDMNAAPTPAREDAHQRVNRTLGMVFFVGSWSMAFGTLFLTMLVLRDKIGFWPPRGIELPSTSMATVATGVLLLSSVLLHLSVARGRRGRPGFLGLWLAGLAVGTAFAALQAWLWYDLTARGRSADSGLYESLFYGLTWVHAAHVACGLAALIWMAVGIARGRYGPHLISTVQNAAIFWHFVDVVWVVLFFAFFVF